MSAALSQRLVAEALGTALLLMAVVGSGIMGERLAGGNMAIALLANAIATGAALYALITTFGPISGAHFNPLVTMVEVIEGHLRSHEAALYVLCQIIGALGGSTGRTGDVRATLVANLTAHTNRGATMVE